MIDTLTQDHHGLFMRYIVCVLVLWILTACQPQKDFSENNLVDILYTNGNIWTGSDAIPEAKVFAVKNGGITFIGDEAPREISARETIDLGGQFVMAGFQDNHVHFMEGGAALASVDLKDAATPEEFKQRISDYAQNLPKGRWILNGNWDHEKWGGTLPHKNWINDVTPDNPVYVIRIDGHMGLLNDAALAATGIDKNTQAPEGGIIMRDADGELTGILKNNALNLVLEKIPPPGDDELMDQFVRAQEHAFSQGLTKVHAVTAYPSETNMLDIFQMARAREIMKIRAFVSTPIESLDMAVDDKATDTGDEILSWGGVKALYDGSLGSTTAWFHDPYSHDDAQSGFPIADPAVFTDLMQKSDDAGLRLSIHAIGDKAIDHTISDMRAMAGDQIRSRRYRIEHFQHPSAAAIKSIAESGIIVSMQPYHAIDDGRWAEERIGNARAQTTYAFRSILDAGGILTFGSDWPVAPLSPLEGIYAAVTRQTLAGAHPDGWVPRQKISAEEAMIAYTKTNAYSFGEEDIAGTLEAGKRADFVVLSADPRRVAPEDIRNVRVEMTVINGEVVYKAE